MKRSEHRQLWLSEYFGEKKFNIKPASEDASFRSYYRVSINNQTYILMDAPPEYEDCRPFVKVLDMLIKHEVHAPHVYAQDLTLGFLLLSDFGNTLYLDELNDKTVNGLYGSAIDTLVQIQSIPSADDLPAYDAELLLTEMQLFRDWFIHEHLGIKLNDEQTDTLTSTFKLLQDSAIEQPQVMVHRDYHSRNLMVTSNKSPGVIDFQDAVHGPITYDLASLLKDCYISWPADKVAYFCDVFTSKSQHITDKIEKNQFMRWFDLMAAQRHLKAIGIFCRLNYRDGKPGYLNDIPRTMRYLTETASKYLDLQAFSQLLEEIQPKLAVPA